jgi:hypothetical protein
MKKLFAFSLILISTIAQAETFDFFEAAYYPYGNPTVTARFEVNKDLGRAWVYVNVDASDADSSLHDDEYKQKIEGLTYDVATKTVLLERDGRLIECAKWKRAGVFGLASGIYETGCTFKHRFVTRDIDDGFYIRKEKRVIVSLKIKE